MRWKLRIWSHASKPRVLAISLSANLLHSLLRWGVSRAALIIAASSTAAALTALTMWLRGGLVSVCRCPVLAFPDCANSTCPGAQGVNSCCPLHLMMQDDCRMCHFQMNLLTIHCFRSIREVIRRITPLLDVMARVNGVWWHSGHHLRERRDHYLFSHFI